MTPNQIVKFVESRKWPLRSIGILRRVIGDELMKGGHSFEQDVDLGSGAIVDFMISGTALEVSIREKGSSVVGRCTRYLEKSGVIAVVVATNVALGLPREICNKPVYVAALGNK